MGASTGAVITGSQLLSRAAASAAARTPNGSSGVEHVVILMMENRSFDHFLSWLPGADGRHDMAYLSTDGNVYPNYPLAPDYQGCGYSDRKNKGKTLEKFLEEKKKYIRREAKRG